MVPLGILATHYQEHGKSAYSNVDAFSAPPGSGQFGSGERRS